MITHRLFLAGLGNVGLNFLRILAAQREALRADHGLELALVGAADSSGYVYAPGGLDLDAVIRAKEHRTPIRALAVGDHDRQGDDVRAMIECGPAEFLLDATPTNLRDGQPGLDLVRAALRQGLPVVMANKGPLVLAFQELRALSDLGTPGQPALRFGGAVGGALPGYNVGARDLSLARIHRLDAVPNGTTQLILSLMSAEQDYATALAEAQRIGIAEPDPALDVDGWDSANKLVILVNALLGQAATLEDVAVQGITDVTHAYVHGERARGRRVVLLASAEGDPDRYVLKVAPTSLPLDHPLARLGPQEMGITFWTDLYGVVTVTCAEQGPQGASMAMLRDLLALCEG